MKKAEWNELNNSAITFRESVASKDSACNAGGEQQRVALARALMCRPKLILADEPTGNHDRLTGAEKMRLQFEVNGDPLSVVMVTHSAEAAAMCDRTLTLEKGRLIGA